MALTNEFGSGNLKKLLLRQAVPASIGILFLTVNLLVDTILVGRWIGSIAIAALTVVTPISFLIASLGLAIGSGGSSVLSRALGSDDANKARKTFAHQIMLTFLLSSVLVVIGLLFTDELLTLFGAKGKILEPARIFFYPILLAGPLQALTAMGNSVIRAEDKARFAMLVTIVPSVMNIVLDVLFIRFLDMGILGAALATAISFVFGFLVMCWFFVRKSEIRLRFQHFAPNLKLTAEIGSLSFTTFSRQAVISVLSVLLNHSLYAHGGETSVSIYGIISKMLMFALFPVNGIAEAFLPIAGYNFGAEKFDRVRKTIKISIGFATGIAIVIYAAILLFAEQLVGVFTTEAAILEQTPNALRWVFAASPVIAIQLIGAGYFQASGNAVKALLLTLTKQGFFLIPLILILPDKFGIFGIWVSFPIADVLATAVTGCFLLREIKTKLKTR